MSTIRSASVVASIASVLVAASAASADFIDFTITGVASGQWMNGIYQGQSFTNKAFTINARALVESVSSSNPSISIVTNGSAAISLESYGDMAVTSSTDSVANRGQGRFAMGLSSGALLVSLGNSAFNTWNMQSSLGPVTGTAVFNTQNWGTTNGALRFSGSSAVTFTAVVTPAPGAIALVGLAGLAGSRRRRA